MKLSRPRGLGRQVRGFVRVFFAANSEGETATAVLTRRMTLPTVAISVAALLAIGCLFLEGARQRDREAGLESIR